MLNKGMVSIIIPVYNRSAYLEESINSVLAQTYQNFEIILIDDGSTDNTLDMCIRLSEEDSRIKVLLQNHAGVSAARNIGIDAAVGEFVFFIDSDDAIHSVLLEALVTALNETGAGMAGTEVVGVGKSFWHLVNEKCKEERSKGYVHHTFEKSIDAVFHGKTPFACIGGVMIRRDLIGDTRFNPSFFIGEDFLFIYENLIKGADTVFLDKKLYYTRIHESNSSWDWAFSGFLNRFERREWVWKSEEKFGRMENANAQKRMVLNVFDVCMRKRNFFDIESQKIRKFLRERRKDLLPAFDAKRKIKFYFGVYFPIGYAFIMKTIGKSKANNKKP